MIKPSKNFCKKFKLVSNQVLAMQQTLNDLPNEIIDIIYDQLDLASQMNFRLVSTRFSKFHLTNFWDFGNKLEERNFGDRSIAITNQVITRNPFIKYLDLSNNNCVDAVENLIYLKTLNINNSSVTTLSNLPNLNLIMVDNDDVQIPRSDNIKVVKTKPFYSDYIPYSFNDFDSPYNFSVTPQPYQLSTGYIDVSRVSNIELSINLTNDTTFAFEPNIIRFGDGGLAGIRFC